MRVNAEIPSSPEHLRTLFDSIVVLELLDQVGGVYELNDAARRYLVSDGPATMAALIPVAPGPHDNWTRLADTVRNGRPSTPIEDDPAAFYVPLVEGTFTTMYRCAMRADLKLRYSALPAPRVLDLGAGGAPWAIAILHGNPAATAVVNDLPGVIGVAERKATEHGVERPGRVATRRLPHGRDRDRRRTTSSCSATCAAPKGPTVRERPDRAGLRCAATRGHR